MSRETKKEIINNRIKHVKRLESELNQIHKAQSKLGNIELKKPIRNGWIKTFKLRDEILRSKSSKVYQEVLSAVLLEIWGSEKKYAEKKWKKFFDIYHKNFQRPGIKRLLNHAFTLHDKFLICCYKSK